MVLEREYYRWLCNFVTRNDYPKELSYSKLLRKLHDTRYVFTMKMDENRARDGVSLRYRFEGQYGYVPGSVELGWFKYSHASTLEVLVALALRCEEDIMYDPLMGDRTTQWFNRMIISLGLGGMTDVRYDELVVDDILYRFFARDYSHDGEGGLFTVRGSRYDMRDLEIWKQANAYFNSIS